MVFGQCFTCKCQREIDPITEEVTMKGGNKRVTGKCKVCGKGISGFTKKEDIAKKQ
jgi:hypothetical protein